MRTVNFSDARGNFKQVLDDVVANRTVTLIKRRDSEDAVVMALNDYNALIETLHLLGSRKNAARLRDAIDRADAAFPGARVLTPSVPRPRKAAATIQDEPALYKAGPRPPHQTGKARSNKRK